MTRPPEPSVLASGASNPEWQDRKIDDLGDLALYCGGSPDSFTGQLLALMAKADPGNRARLALGFPYEHANYVLWAASPEPPTWRQMREAYRAAATLAHAESEAGG